MSRDSRRLFASPDKLSVFTPVYLWDLLNDSRELLATDGFDIGARENAHKLDHLAVTRALAMASSRGGDEINKLADALFFISHVATPRNRALLEEEIAARKPKPDLGIPENLSDADFVLLVWLKDRTLVEAAAARVSLRSRRRFHYYIPTDLAVAEGIGPVTPAQLAQLNTLLGVALGKDGRARGLSIIPFLESPDEDWFLIRRSRFPERITYHDEEGNEVSKTIWLRAYDAVIFDRRTGVLKVNSRDKLHECYRAAFSVIYAGGVKFFEQRAIFTLEPLRSADVRTLSVDGIPGLQHVALRECKYYIYELGTLSKRVVGKDDWYAETAGQLAPIPAEAQILDHAKFHISTTHREAPIASSLYTGNVLSFSRDDESVAFENFLRARGFMLHVQVITRTRAA